MKNPLIKRLKNDLKSHAGRYAAIFIIFVVMVTIISTFLVVANGVRMTYEHDHTNNLLEDGLFSARAEIEENVLAETESLNVSIYENFYIDTTLSFGSTLRIYPNRSHVNLPAVWEGEMPQSKHQLAIDRLFAENHGLTIGDTLTISEQEYSIVGLVSMPDYSSLFIKNTDLMMDSYGFGVAVTTQETFEGLPQEHLVYNYAYRYNNRDLSNDEKVDLSDEIKDTLVTANAPLTGFLMAEDNQAISFLGDDMGSDIPMMKVFLYIMLLIMAFVFTVIITSSLEEDAAVTGTLLASGYRKGELLRYYLALPVSVTLLGALIGNILSYTAALPLFKRMYYSAYSLPPMELKFNLEAFLLTTLLPVILILLINMLALFRTLSLSPLKFLRRDLKRTKNRKAVKLPNISFMGRFRIRVILQNMGSYITLFFGMLFASFILLFGLCMSPMINHYIQSIEDAAVSEYQYILKAPYELENTKQAEKFTLHTLETYYSAADKNLEISFYGIPDDSIYWDIDLDNMEESSVIISEELSKKMGAYIGDTLNFTDPYSHDEYTLKIADTRPYPVGFTAFMEFEQLNSMLDKKSDVFSGYFSDQKLDIPEDMIATIITPEDMSGLGDQMLSTFGDMAVICLGAAIVIYLVLMYILTKIVVDKNAQNISFMKVMGYREKEIRKLYLTATVIAVAVSLLLSLPLIYLGLEGAFFLAFMQVSGYLEPYLPMHLFAIVVAVGFVTYLLINLLHMRRIRKIEMAEVLKNRE